jgi:putative transposase
MLVDRLGVSERRACRICGQHRSTQRHEALRTDTDRELRLRLRGLSREHPRWGYRRACRYLRTQGLLVNHKRVQRVWREEGLRVPPVRRKRRRVGTSTAGPVHFRAAWPDQVWSLDFQFDTTTDGRWFKILNVMDEHTREFLATRVERSIDSDGIVAVLDEVASRKGCHPDFVRMDNGPEMTADALRDWCRQTRTGACFIEPGSPWQNPFIESLGARLRDEVLAVEIFDSLLEAQVLIEDWRGVYNHQHPHSSLGWKTPAEYAASIRRR